MTSRSGRFEWRKSWLVMCVAIMAALAGGSARAADVAVRAEVDRTQVTLDEQLQLQVIIEGRFRSVEQPQRPPLDDFDVYMRGRSQGMQIVNGEVTASNVFTYLLVPKREGKFTIGPFVVQAGGQDYKTQPIAITVGGGPGVRGAPGSAGDTGEPAAREDRDLFVVGRVDKQNAYVNEQILYTFYLYRAERAAQITNVNYSQPDFQGFWVEKLKDSEKQSYKMLNGRRYVVTELSTAIFPTTSGKLTVGPAALQLVLLTTPFGFSLFDRGVEKVLRTKPIAVDVSSLPPAGKPPIFEGAVGEALELTAKLDRAEVVEGDPVTLSVRVEGIGNVKTFSKPRLPDLPQFKLYDSDSKTEVQTLDRVSGSRSYEIVLVPKDEGEHDVPPIRLAYFDTGEGRYRTLETKPLHITAVRSSDPNRVVAADQPAAQRDIQILGKDIGHIHTQVPVSDVLTPLWSRGIFGLLAPMPLLAAIGATVLRRRRERFATDVALARSTRARKLARKTLAAAQRHLQAGHGADFYAEVSRALLQYVGDKLNVSAIGMTHATLRQRLESAGIPVEIAVGLIAMLERCDMARFAPGSMGGERMRETLGEAESLLVALDSSWGRRGAREGAGSVVGITLVVGLAAILAASGARAQNDGTTLGGKSAAATPPAAGEYVPPAELLRRGNAAYEGGRFGDAVAAYVRAEQLGVRNGPLYYNLGNAYYKNGELGNALVSYRRAEMLSPRDPLVKANLEYVLARREDKSVQTGSMPILDWVGGAFASLSLNEWIAIAAILYTVVCVLWIARALGRDRGRGALLRVTWIASAALLALAIVCMGFKAWTVRGVQRGVVTVSKVDVTSGPGRTYTPEFSLHEGAEVRIEERRPDWLRVSVSDQLRGWIPATSVVEI